MTWGPEHLPSINFLLGINELTPQATQTPYMKVLLVFFAQLLVLTAITLLRLEGV